MKIDVAIVGAGLAGLACARRLGQLGIEATLFEAGDRVGGRVRTDESDGFLLDRGFQVFLTAYPEARRVLAYDPLDLKAFYPGALIQTENDRLRISDPWRKPGEAFSELLSPVVPLSDKARMGILRRKLASTPLDAIMAGADLSTIRTLQGLTFSERCIRRFFRPFLGGVFLDPALQTSSRMFEFVLKMFALGDAALPAKGMEEIPRQLAGHLKREAIHLDARVEGLDRGRLRIAGGETVDCTNVVLAVEGPAAAGLVPAVPAPPYRCVTTLYYSCDHAPERDPILMLNGTDRGPINNFCFPSRVAPTYAPAGRDLLSVTVLLDTGGAQVKKLQESVRAQLTSWFGNRVDGWEHLQTDRIEHALPAQMPTERRSTAYNTLAKQGIVVCGDYRETGSINGALTSGRKAAEAVALARKA